MARVHDGMITANPEGALQCTVGESGSSNGCAGNSSLVYCSMLSTRCPLSRSIPSLHGQVWRSRSAENGTWHTLANDPRDPSRIPTKRAKRARPVRRSSPSYPKTQTNSRLARRAVSIVIDPWASPRPGACRRRCRRFGFPVRAGKHRPATGCHAPWAKTWIQVLGKDGHKGGPGQLDQNLLGQLRHGRPRPRFWASRVASSWRPHGPVSARFPMWAQTWHSKIGIRDEV